MKYDKFEWRVNIYTAFNCESFCKDAIKFGFYEHTLCRPNSEGIYEDGEYKGYVNLPSLKKQNISGTREEVKKEIERIIKNWFEYVLK